MTFMLLFLADMKKLLLNHQAFYHSWRLIFIYECLLPRPRGGMSSTTSPRPLLVSRVG